MQYPEFIFRFRPYSPLILKELLYGEVFFVSKEELNDPYDTKSPAFFENDKHVIERLISWIIGNILYPQSFKFSKKQGEEIASFLANRPLIQDELIELLDSTEFSDIVIRN